MNTKIDTQAGDKKRKRRYEVELGGHSRRHYRMQISALSNIKFSWHSQKTAATAQQMLQTGHTNKHLLWPFTSEKCSLPEMHYELLIIRL